MQLCSLATHQYQIDRINWINALEVDIDRLRRDIQKKEAEISQRFNELNTPHFRRAVYSVFTPLQLRARSSGLPRSAIPYYPPGTRYNPIPDPAILRRRTPTPHPRPPPSRSASYTSNPSALRPCRQCGSTNHWILQCPRYYCRGCLALAPGHRRSECPQTNVQEEDWHTNEDVYDDNIPDDGIANITEEPYH